MKKIVALIIALLCLTTAVAESCHIDNYEYLAFTEDDEGYKVVAVDIFGLEELCAANAVKQAFIVYDGIMYEVIWNYDECRFSTYDYEVPIKNYNFNSEIEFINLTEG